jgi:hypothetical protein
MKIAPLSIMLSLFICVPAKALIYKYTIRTGQDKIRMEIEHSRKKETIIFDFNQASNFKKAIR